MSNPVPSSRTPLEVISSMEGDDDEDGNCWQERTLWTRVWQGLAIASVVVNLVAMAVEAGMAILAGIVALIVAPVVFYFQFQLQDKDSLRTIQNAMRQQVNRMQVENNKLSSEITDLEANVSRLRDSEARLDEITKEQGSNVESFVALVKENGETLEQLKTAVKADTMQALVSAIIDSDWDSSASFSDQELKILEMRLRNVTAVNVNTSLLESKMQATNRSLADVLGLLKELDDEDIPSDERIFQLHEEELVEE